MKYKLLGYVFVGLAFAAVVSLVYLQKMKLNQSDDLGFSKHRDETAGWETYQNDKYGFLLKYPKDFWVFNSDYIDQTKTLSYVPPCDEDSAAACVVYAGTEFSDTNLDTAAVSINLLPQVSGETTCMQEDNKQYSEAAAGHRFQDERYRYYRNEQCWEVNLRISQANAANYPAGEISQISEEKLTNLTRILATIKDSFKFLK